VPTAIEEIVDLYETWGQNRYDESVSQLAHALQTAALAEADGAPDALVGAALLHDVGHVLHLAESGGVVTGYDVDPRHEAVGSRYLAALFPPAVTGPVALHVAAKRYRCAVEPGYAAALSEGSTRSLGRQGGAMSRAECEAFESRSGFGAAVLLRGWDDGGKVDGRDVASLDHYRTLLQRLSAR
jgi:phosphonate degradation associated HDIG domain protein